VCRRHGASASGAADRPHRSSTGSTGATGATGSNATGAAIFVGGSAAGGANTSGASKCNYQGINGTDQDNKPCNSATEAAKSQLPLPAGTITRFYATLSAAPGASPRSQTFKVYANGASLATLCTITTTNTSCDVTLTQAWTAFDKLVIVVEQSATAPTAAVTQWFFTFVPSGS